jgi:intracellular protein transport protein USO1
MLRILESQAPAKQTATDTINVLSSRLQSATLLEDRRAAILGLRSFAKLYPASVASGALRDLIACFRRDGDDLDTIKVVLETLLMLINPDEKSLEASDEIALWLADEFSQRQDNITALLDLLESKEFYPRLYSLQLISRIATARPERTQESIFTAPLGVSRLVAVLDDKREAARNEALLLLIALTPSSPELQKVVAFENAFDRIFALIDAEGSLTHGSMTIQDCLTLLANLLKLNVSNQSYFREIGCVSKLARLLAVVSDEEDSADGVSDWARPQRDMNVWGLLAIVQLLLIPRAQGTPLNQSAFWKSGIVLQALHLAFSSTFGVGIRAKALSTCADLIRGNGALQEKFGDLSVPKVQSEASRASVDQSLTNGHSTTNVIEALLKLTLEPAALSLFDVRLAACECVKAFFTGHTGIRAHVLRRAIEGHQSGEDEIPNILTVLISPPDSRATSDPYQPWMASVLMLHLLYEDSDAKAIALSVSEGNAGEGEEVITFVQSIASNLISGYQQQDDERILVGYLMLLCGWLFEDPDAVNDFLGEGSCVPSLIQATNVVNQSMLLAAGLGTFLLGIIYEFSTKDSPVPRSKLHNLLVSGLGREVYIDRLTKLRENPILRDFEVLPQGARSASEGGLPDVFFDKTFVEFVKDQFSRILRAIDRDPGFEVSVISNGVQKGVSRELVDSLRAQVEEKVNRLRNLESEMVLLNRKLEQEELDHRRTKDSSGVELARIKQINDSLHKHHEEETRTANEAFAVHQGGIIRQYEEQLRNLDSQLKQSNAENEQKATKIRERNETEIGDLKHAVHRLELQLEKASKDHVQDLQTAHEEYMTQEETLQARARRAEEKVEELEDMIKTIRTALEGARSERESLKLRVDEKEMARREAQTELDDLLIVFADLEAKRTQDKKRLKALGEAVSEGEESDEEDEGDNEDEDDEDG